MFVMMNAARLGVGMQGARPHRGGLPERRGLRQGPHPDAFSLSGPKAPDKAADPIIVHPDVRKMLLTARAYAEGGRALAMWTTLQIDKELASDDEDVKRKDAPTSWPCSRRSSRPS